MYLLGIGKRGKQSTLLFSLFIRKVEAYVDVSEWYYRMFQKNLKLRTNIVVGTVLQNYETPQKTVDVTEAFSFYPPCAMATEEYANDTSPLKNREREETKFVLYVPPRYTIYTYTAATC